MFLNHPSACSASIAGHWASLGSFPPSRSEIVDVVVAAEAESEAELGVEEEADPDAVAEGLDRVDSPPFATIQFKHS